MKQQCVVLLAIAFLVAPAMSDLIGNPDDGTQEWSLTQDWVHPAFAANLVWGVSDFEIAVDYYLYDVVVVGHTTHTGGVDGTGANFDIWDGLPWDGGNLVLSASDGYEHYGSAGLMGADFQGQVLSAGSYYIVFQGERDFLNTGGMTLSHHTFAGNANDWQWNPGEGLGFGPYRQLESAIGGLMDYNWQLNASPVPEPATLLLLVIGAGALLRRH